MSKKLIYLADAKKAMIGWETEPTDEEIEYTLNNLKVVDAEKVKHGKWIDRGYEVECPFCGFTCNDTHYLGNGAACPNCAARMDG